LQSFLCFPSNYSYNINLFTQAHTKIAIFKYVSVDYFVAASALVLPINSLNKMHFAHAYLNAHKHLVPTITRVNNITP